VLKLPETQDLLEVILRLASLLLFIEDFADGFPICSSLQRRILVLCEDFGIMRLFQELKDFGSNLTTVIIVFGHSGLSEKSSFLDM